MKKIFLVLTAISLACFSSCSYDDSALVEKVDQLDSRVAKLEKAVQNINTSITDLQSIVKALDEGDKIVSVTPIEGGFEVTFSKSGKKTIKNGKDGADGQDGVTPVVSTKLDADGIYYWTVNGEYLLDNAGKKLPVTSHITPKVRLEGDNFEISYDNGKNWEVLGAAGSIPPGAIVINQVKDEAGSVTFVLSDGQTIVIPKVAEFTMEVDKYAGAINPGAEETTIYVKLKGADKDVVVDAITTGGFEVTEVKINFTGDIPYQAELHVSVPDPMPANGKIFIFASNSKGVTVSQVLKFEKGEFTLDEDMSMSMSGDMLAGGVMNISATGDVVLLFVKSTYAYQLSISDNVKSWISDITEQFKGQEGMENAVALNVAPNTTGKEREGYVSFILGTQTLASVKIIQAGN